MEKEVGKILYALVGIIEFEDLLVELSNQLYNSYGNESKITFFNSDEESSYYKIFEKNIEVPRDFGMLPHINKVIYDTKGPEPTLYGPLLDDDLGKMSIVRLSREKEFTKREIEFFKRILDRTSPLIKNAISYKRLGKTLQSLVDTLSAAVDARDFVTSGHSKRVALFSEEIAKKLKFDQRRKLRLEYSALLHDIGKIGVPEGILFKSGSLTDEEYLSVKRHASLGGALLKNVSFPEYFKSIPIIVKSHHEKLDGSGYPSGLVGSQIPEESQIIAICDVFDALTSKRQYRGELDFSTAFSILDGERGELNNEFLNIFKSIPNKKLREIHKSYRI
jgi:HD-GYP domain-containing protein (c-di-GMP phosphodiesterase class II)